MGCFLGCFGGAEERKQRRRRGSRTPPPHQRKESYVPRRRINSPKRLTLVVERRPVSQLRLGEKPEKDVELCESPPKQSTVTEVADDSVIELSVGEKPEAPGESPLKQLIPKEVTDDLFPDLSCNNVDEKLEQGTPLRENSLKELTAALADESVPVLSYEPDQQGSTSSRKKVRFDLKVTAYVEAPSFDELRNSQEEDEEEAAKEKRNYEGEAATSPCAYPFNHRYQDCGSSDDEDVIDDEDEEHDDSDDDDDEDVDVCSEGNEEESYESFFSLPLEEEGKSLAEVNSPGSGVHPKASARDRSQYVHSVLNPVENLSKWKEVKDRAVPAKNSMKERSEIETKETVENLSKWKEVKDRAVPAKNSMKENNVRFETETKETLEPTFKTKSPTKSGSKNSTKHEILIDTSLSSWLGTKGNSQSEVTEGSYSIRSNSSLNREEHPILGALTLEDIKQSSVTSSPRKSPCRSADDIPIVGSVGSYWSSSRGGDSSATSRFSSVTKGIPNTTSKYREDQTVSWHSTPFEERLERALKDGSAVESCSSLSSAAVC